MALFARFGDGTASAAKRGRQDGVATGMEDAWASAASALSSATASSAKGKGKGKGPSPMVQTYNASNPPDETPVVFTRDHEKLLYGVSRMGLGTAVKERTNSSAALVTLLLPVATPLCESIEREGASYNEKT